MGYAIAGCLLCVLLIPGMYVVMQAVDMAMEDGEPSKGGRIPAGGAWGASVVWPLVLSSLLMFVLVFLVYVVLYAPYLVAKGGRPELDRWIAE